MADFPVRFIQTTEYLVTISARNVDSATGKAQSIVEKFQEEDGKRGFPKSFPEYDDMSDEWDFEVEEA
jgi:hypothetical protein